MLESLLYAADAPQAAQGPAGGLVQFVPLIFILAVFYFFIIRPQQKKSREHQDMINSVKKGDQILTTGGIYGTVLGFKDNVLEVKIAENVKVLMSRQAVSAKVASPVKQPATAEVVS